MFTADINKSVSAYFGSDKYEQVLDSFGIIDNSKTVSDKINAWCVTCGLVYRYGW